MEEKKYNTKEIEKLFEAGAHLGHKKNRLHPKARKYVYKMVNGVAVIDLTITAEQLHVAKEYLKDAAKNGKRLLVVGTKRVASQFVQEYCKEKGIPHITTKWMPGLLTNFETLSKNTKKMIDYEVGKENGSWDQFVKHERTKMQKDLNRLKRLYGGIEDMKKKPDVLFIIDIKREKNALKEAKQNGIPVIAITDTNTNPDTVDYPVVANDDSPTSAHYVIESILSAYTVEKSEEAKATKPKEVKKEEVVKTEEAKVETKEEVKEEKKVKKVAKKTVKKETKE
ncbi:MAG: 30S ribosomal protein S2 [Candidatus Roizmanbacteria bacterium]|nr:30S ribosomal protein S2 [Candidatus Roizmanbacteria bacterium]